MKRTCCTLLGTLLNILMGNGSYAGPPDTVYVSHAANAYLLFPQAVHFVDIGATGQYVAKVEENSVFIRAKRQPAQMTTLLIKTGDTYFTAVLCYTPSLGVGIYDYRPVKPAQSVPVAAPAPTQAKVNLDTVQARLSGLDAPTRQRPLRRKRRESLTVVLTQLKNDRQVTYLQLSFTNRSSVDYTIEYVGFERVEKRGKRFSRNNTNRQPVESYPLPAVRVLPARKKTVLAYAIPLFALTRGSHLLVTFRETNGARVVPLRIPARLITQGALLNDDGK